jgi:5-methylcytosine-specific restriction endonuclease McrA
MTKKQKKEAHRKASLKWRNNNINKARRDNRNWARTHKQRAAQITQQWRKNNPRKHRANMSANNATRHAKYYGAPGKWTGAQWFALCKMYGNVCLRCHRKRRLTPDHVIPFSKGGTNYRNNIQPLCKPCNSGKRDKTTDYRTQSVTQTRSISNTNSRRTAPRK